MLGRQRSRSAAAPTEAVIGQAAQLTKPAPSFASIANALRRRGAITTIGGNRAAVHVIGYTIEGLLLCLITTAALPRWELGPVAGDADRC